MPVCRDKSSVLHPAIGTCVCARCSRQRRAKKKKSRKLSHMLWAVEWARCIKARACVCVCICRCQTRGWNGFAVIILYLLRCMKILLDCHLLFSIRAQCLASGKAMLCKQNEIRSKWWTSGKRMHVDDGDGNDDGNDDTGKRFLTHRIQRNSCSIRLNILNNVCVHGTAHTHTRTHMYALRTRAMNLMVRKFMEHFLHFKFRCH